MKKIHILKFICIFSMVVSSQTVVGQELILPSITTYIDDTVIEQKTVLTSQDIEERHTDSLTALLQSEGIQILAQGAYGLLQSPSIRGFTDETVRVVIDGVCVNNAQYGTFDFSSININDIERIEIVRGGFTEGVCDEGSVGGVIYITTKKQQLGLHFNSDSQVKTYFNANLPFDTFSQNLGLNWQAGDNSFFKAGAKGTWANNRFLFKNYKGLTLERFNSEVKDANANLQFLHYFGNGNYFSANDLFYIGDKNVPGVENSAYSGNQWDLTNKIFFTLNFPAIQDCMRLENSFAWLCDNRHYKELSDSGKSGGSLSMGGGSDSMSQHYVNSFKLTSAASFYGLKNFSQSLGISLDYTHLKSTNDGNHSQFTLTVKETSKIKWGANNSSKDDEAAAKEAFWGNGKINLSVPLAFKLCNQNFAFIPKAAISAEFNHINFILDIYRMVQFPNMDDLYWNGSGFHGNPDLTHESGWSSDFSINIHHFAVPFSVCFFANYYKNKIQWNLNSGQPENLASAFYAGVDFSMEKSLFDFITIKADAEYLYNRLLDKSNKLTYGKKIMWTPDWTAALSIDFDFEDFNWIVDASYTGKRYTSNLNSYWLEPYILLNSTLEFNKISWFSPYFRGENLLNADYEAAENYPVPGVSLTVGVRFKK